MKEAKNKVPLYRKFEENYKHDVEEVTLENRKKQLSDIRNFYKPLDREEMKQHNRQYSSLRKEKDAKIQADRLKQKAELEEWNKNL